MKYIIEHNNKCKQCEFMVKYPLSNLGDIAIICQIDGKPVEEDSECYMKPLKVKELEWKFDDVFDRWISLYDVYVIYQTLSETYVARGHDYKTKDFKTLEQAKAYCQERHEEFTLSQLEV